MAKYARLDGGNTVVELFEHPTLKPSDTHTPAIAALFIPCPDSVVGGATKSGTVWTNPAPAPVVVTLPPLTPMQFYMAFKPSERVAIKGSADALVKEFWSTYELAVQLNVPIDPGLSSVKDGLNYLVSLGILASPARVPDILAGVPQ